MSTEHERLASRTLHPASRTLHPSSCRTLWTALELTAPVEACWMIDLAEMVRSTDTEEES